MAPPASASLEQPNAQQPQSEKSQQQPIHPITSNSNPRAQSPPNSLHLPPQTLLRAATLQAAYNRSSSAFRRSNVPRMQNSALRRQRRRLRKRRAQMMVSRRRALQWHPKRHPTESRCATRRRTLRARGEGDATTAADAAGAAEVRAERTPASCATNSTVPTRATSAALDGCVSGR